MNETFFLSALFIQTIVIISLVIENYQLDKNDGGSNNESERA